MLHIVTHVTDRPSQNWGDGVAYMQHRVGADFANSPQLPLELAGTFLNRTVEVLDSQFKRFRSKFDIKFRKMLQLFYY